MDPLLSYFLLVLGFLGLLGGPLTYGAGFFLGRQLAAMKKKGDEEGTRVMDLGHSSRYYKVLGILVTVMSLIIFVAGLFGAITNQKPDL
jgi:ABC-type antimicrobial peptide transport system permease subunit